LENLFFDIGSKLNASAAEEPAGKSAMGKNAAII
jgi:hypothetical protein